jgi:16S rRNA (adenine(1408)-N(1))-methyltransferase
LARAPPLRFVFDLFAIELTERREKMESIRGKQPLSIDAPILLAQMHRYPHRLFDLGTGDGRFVRHVAECWPGYFSLGIDACRENLHAASRTAPANACFVIANVLALPSALFGQATHITINFPWGSLLEGLLAGDPALMHNLVALGLPGSKIELRLNGGALGSAGWTLEEGVARVVGKLRDAGFVIKRGEPLNADDLHRLPTTWAKRLAFGRDPHAISIRGVLQARGSFSKNSFHKVDQPLPVLPTPG